MNFYIFGFFNSAVLSFKNFYCWKPELSWIRIRWNFWDTYIDWFSRFICISKTDFIFLTVYLQKMMIFDLLWPKTVQTFIFREQKFHFFLKKKINQVICKCILTAIGQKITVPQSCNVAGWCIDPWRIMGFKETKSLNTFFIRFLCANVFP